MEVKKMKKQLFSTLMCLLLMIGVFLPLAVADVSLTSRFDETGNYGMVAAGVGLTDVTSGDITIDFSGTVVVAYLYWAGVDIGLEGMGDNAVVFEGVSVEADETFGPEFWYQGFGGIRYHYVYLSDVTDLVTGSGTYAIVDVDIGHKNYGAGLVVIYEDPSLPVVRVVLMDGLDGFWFGWEDPVGPNSDVVCFEFAAGVNNRDVDMLLLVGGTEHDDRPNAVWTQTGDGDKPADLIDPPSSANGPYPLVGSDGASWDTYSDTVGVAVGDEWLCVQVESIISWEDPLNQEPFVGRGTSALLIAAGFILPVERPAGLSPGFWKHNVRVALGYPGRYSVPHEGEPRMDYDSTVALAKAATGETDPTLALEAALDAFNARGRGSDVIRLDMANAFNEAAGYAPYSD
jgi:hypothetical protein